MKLYFVILYVIIFTLQSCKNDTGANDKRELISFLETNYEFNHRALNKYRGKYFLMIQEIPEKKIEELEKFNLTFDSLVLEIDNAILSKEKNIEKLNSEYNGFISKIP